MKLPIIAFILIVLCSCKKEKYVDEMNNDNYYTYQEFGTEKSIQEEKLRKKSVVKLKTNMTDVDKYINNYYKIAQSEQEHYGIPASIKLAQGIIESGCGKSGLTIKNNNHFGIKPGNHWRGDKNMYKTQEWDNNKKKFITINSNFRSYKSAWWSYRDHSHFLMIDRYKPCRDCGNNYKCWAHQLKKCGYATDPKYSEKLIYIIETYKLYELDNV